jgi:hypothetical protein
MAKKTILSFYDATWIATVNAVLEKWDTEAAIHYGDLGLSIYGKKVGTTFASGLFEMDRRVFELNRNRKLQLPYINGMVVNAQTKLKTGAPKRPKALSDPEYIWPLLKKNGKQWLAELTVLLGYPMSGTYTIPSNGMTVNLEVGDVVKQNTKQRNKQPSKSHQNPGYVTGADEGAPRAPTEKTQALHKRIVEKLILKAGLQDCVPSPHSCICKPDLIASPNGGKIKFLFEVKPDRESSSIIAAIGQLQTYASEHDVKLNHCAIVIPTLKTAIGEGTNKGVAALSLKVLKQLGVSIIEYESLNDRFHGLNKFVSQK